MYLPLYYHVNIFFARAARIKTSSVSLQEFLVLHAHNIKNIYQTTSKEKRDE